MVEHGAKCCGMGSRETFHMEFKGPDVDVRPQRTDDLPGEAGRPQAFEIGMENS